MATFNPALSTDRDKVRQKIGDADVADAQVQDETIDAYLNAYSQSPSPVLKTAHQLCLDLAAKWARYGTVTIDDQQQRAENTSKAYLLLASTIADEMRDTAASASSFGAIMVGGLDDCRGPIDAYTYDIFVTRIPPSGP